MSGFIRCPECQFCFGPYLQYIDLAKQAMFQEKAFSNKKIDPEKLVFNTNLNITMENIFDTLEINKRCCRMHITAQTHFDKKYK